MKQGVQMQIGQRIRQRRQQIGLSLKDLGERAGLTAGFLSQLENDQNSPSLNSLQAIATALDVPMFYFLDDSLPPNPIVRASERRTLFFPDSQIAYELLAPDLSGQMLPMLLHMDPGARRIARPLAKANEQWMHVLQGRLEIKIRNAVYELGRGDTIYYDGNTLQEFAALGAEPLHLIICMTPPAL